MEKKSLKVNDLRSREKLEILEENIMSGMPVILGEFGSHCIQGDATALQEVWQTALSRIRSEIRRNLNLLQA